MDKIITEIEHLEKRYELHSRKWWFLHWLKKMCKRIKCLDALTDEHDTIIKELQSFVNQLFESDEIHDEQLDDINSDILHIRDRLTLIEKIIEEDISGTGGTTLEPVVLGNKVVTDEGRYMRIAKSIDVSRYKNSVLFVTTISDTLSNNNVYCMFIDSSGNVYSSTCFVALQADNWARIFYDASGKLYYNYNFTYTDSSADFYAYALRFNTETTEQATYVSQNYHQNKSDGSLGIEYHYEFPSDLLADATEFDVYCREMADGNVYHHNFRFMDSFEPCRATPFVSSVNKKVITIQFTDSHNILLLDQMASASQLDAYQPTIYIVRRK